MARKFNFLKRSDETARRRSCRFRDEIMESPSLIKREWLQASGWVAVPQTQNGYVSMMEWERLAKALASFDYADDLLLIYPADPSVECSCLTFPPTLDGFTEAATGGAHEAAGLGALDYLITNVGNPLFVFHHTSDDFSLLAGGQAFVEMALSASVTAGNHDWHEYATHPGHGQADRELYSEVERWYKPSQ